MVLYPNQRKNSRQFLYYKKMKPESPSSALIFRKMSRRLLKDCIVRPAEVRSYQQLMASDVSIMTGKRRAHVILLLEKSLTKI